MFTEKTAVFDYKLSMTQMGEGIVNRWVHRFTRQAVGVLLKIYIETCKFKSVQSTKRERRQG